VGEQLTAVQLNCAVVAVIFDVTGFVGGGQEMDRLVPLLVPVVAGFDPVTRILYPVPAAVLDGMVALIEPDVVS
jgi:hypothetical protein